MLLRVGEKGPELPPSQPHGGNSQAQREVGAPRFVCGVPEQKGSGPPSEKSPRKDGKRQLKVRLGRKGPITHRGCHMFLVLKTVLIPPFLNQQLLIFVCNSLP